jgi:carbamoyl-phosphate synthase/aspartate carbamoyltransferase/dihydroorotase
MEMDAFVLFQAVIVYNVEGSPRICVVDYGLKYNELRCLLKRGARLDVVPWDHPLNPEQFDGLFLSNGPGDPAVCGAAIDNIRKVMLHEDHKPIFGICLGHQLLAVAAGFSTFKMK